MFIAVCYVSLFINVTVHLSQVIYEQDGVLLTTKGLTESGSNLFLGRLRISREVSGFASI